MKVVSIDSKRDNVAKLKTHSIEQNLERYCQFFERLDADSFDLFPSFYHYRVRYSSPLHDVNGPEKIKAIFKQLVQRCESPRLIIRDFTVTGQHGFVYWKFVRNGDKPHAVAVTGLSRIKFDGYGRVVSHRDIWDTGSAPRNTWHRLRDWWGGMFSRRSKKARRAAPPKEFHGSPPF